jgi:hypothetical protein
VGLFDWLSGRRRGGQVDHAPISWHVYRDGDDVVAEDGRGGVARAACSGARSVRLVPLSSGNHHTTPSGWQVALSRAEGDVLLGKPLADWRDARALVTLVCEKAELPLDDLTERLFSRVGRYAAPNS